MAFPHEIVGADTALGYGRSPLYVGADDGPSADAMQALAGLNQASMAQALGPVAYQNAMLRALAERNASAVITKTPMDSRTLILPFPETTVPAGASRDVQVLPQCLFRGERLLIPSDIAGLVVLDDIRIGTVSQFAAVGPVPGRSFSEVGVGIGTLFDTAEPGYTILLRVRNISGNDITFRATLFGRAVR